MASTPTSSVRSQSTTMTTPPALSPVQPEATTNAVNENDTSDIWASGSPPANPTDHVRPLAPTPELSDLPSLRRQHMTSGYREGLSTGKAKVMQSAFDQGYPLGITLGLRVGAILGALEGLVATPSVQDDKERRKRVEELLDTARKELDVKKLLEGVEESVVAEVESVEGLERIGEVLRRWEAKVLPGLGWEGEVGNERVGRRGHDTTKSVKPD